MAISSPAVTWYNVDKVNPVNSNTVKIAQPYDFGVVDAGYTPTANDYYSFLIWNNRAEKVEKAPQMEEVSIGIKDVDGGNGSTLGKEVWAINESTKWFWAKIDSLGETDSAFAQIGANLTKPIGTTASTTHPDESKATVWVTSKAYAVGDYAKPATANGFIYKAVKAGTSGATAPTWSVVEGETKTDGTVDWISVKLVNKPSANNIILGVPNDGTLANAGGNFAKVTLKIEAPLNARSGRQDLKLRTSYRYV